VSDSKLVTDAVVQFERRSRAILVADVVSYTRLMETAELETHTRFRALRVEVIDPTVVSGRGEIVKNTGDGFVAVFETPSDAVQCATELQQAIASHEASQPPERRIAFRAGIHWEPVIFDLNDVYGRGVNTAVRLQTAAPAGGVVISSALLDQLDQPGRFKFDDLGELRLKNLSRPVHAFSLALPGVDRSAATGFSGGAPGSIKLPSIAVLPFANLSLEPADNYFAEGLVEDIILTLSNISELLTVARASTVAFLRSRIDPVKVSEKLGARYFLSGSVRRAGRRLRLSVELVDVATSSIMWAEKYDTRIEDLFGTQDEIAAQIVGRIGTYVRRSEIDRALRKPAQSLNAYDYLLRALDLLYKLDFANFSRARTMLERACEEDYAYAAPYAYLADWHMFNILEGWSPDPAGEVSEVMRLSNCAIERDPSNSLALAIQGHAKSVFFRDYDVALELFDRALAISPHSANVWMFSSATYGFIGEAAQGIARAERAIRLSPLDQQGFVNYSRLGQNHYLNGTYEDAIRWSRKALSLNPRYGTAVRVILGSLVALGRADEARQMSEYHRQILPLFSVSGYEPRCPFKEPLRSLHVERLKAAGLPI